MNNKILFMIAIVFSAASLGNDFTDRWFWFNVGEKETGTVIKITLKPERKSSYLKDGSGNFIGSNTNYLVQVYSSLGVNHADWHQVFIYSVELARGNSSIESLIPFVVLHGEPIFDVVVSQPTVFKPVNIDLLKSNNNTTYCKVLYSADNGLNFSIYLEKLPDSNYRVSAIFLESSHAKYSYRDYNFKRDFGDGGAGTGTGVTTAQVLTLLPDHSDISPFIHKNLRFDNQEQFLDKKIELLYFNFHSYSLRLLVK